MTCFESSLRKTAAILLLAAVMGPARGDAQAAGTVREPDAPMSWDFKPGDVASHSLVVVAIYGMDFKTYLPGRGPKASPAGAELAEWTAARTMIEQLLEGEYDQRKMQELDRAITGSLGKKAGDESGAADFSAAQQESPEFMKDWLDNILKDRNALVVPFHWTRDPRKSREALADFTAWLPQVSAAAGKARKPVYIVAHSWGSVLAYTLLKRFMETSSPVGVDRLITLGSPLSSSRAWLTAFVHGNAIAEGLPIRVEPLTNAGQWINFLAKRDLISGEIKAADKNIRVDEPADKYEDELKKALAAGNLAAIKDLAVLKKQDFWHKSYRDDAHLSFPSINGRLDIDITHRYILPLAFY